MKVKVLKVFNLVKIIIKDLIQKYETAITSFITK